jgi:hypothetical protein
VSAPEWRGPRSAAPRAVIGRPSIAAATQAAIRKAYGTASLRTLAKQFDVGVETVRRIGATPFEASAVGAVQ